MFNPHVPIVFAAERPEGMNVYFGICSYVIRHAIKKAVWYLSNGI
jgi:hypothetical protein